jgi:hypothetical protein
MLQEALQTSRGIPGVPRVTIRMQLKPEKVALEVSDQGTAVRAAVSTA